MHPWETLKSQPSVYWDQCEQTELTLKWRRKVHPGWESLLGWKGGAVSLPTLSTECRRNINNHRVFTTVVLKFPKTSSGTWQVPTAWSHGWTPRALVTHSRHPAQLLSHAPPSCCQGIVIFHHLLPQLNLYQCLGGQRLW